MAGNLNLIHSSISSTVWDLEHFLEHYDEYYALDDKKATFILHNLYFIILKSMQIDGTVIPSWVVAQQDIDPRVATSRNRGMNTFPED